MIRHGLEGEPVALQTVRIHPDGAQVDEPNIDLCRVPGPLRLPNSPNSRPVRALSQSLYDTTMISFTVTRSDAHTRPMKQQTGGAPTMTNIFRMRNIIESSEGSLMTPHE